MEVENIKKIKHFFKKKTLDFVEYVKNDFN